MSEQERCLTQILCVANTEERRKTLQNFFASVPDLCVGGIVLDHKQALEELGSKPFDIAIICLREGDRNAIELTRQMREVKSSVRVLVLTASDTPKDIFAALDAGADGYVLDHNFAGLESAIRTVRLGTVWLDPGIARQVLECMVSPATGLGVGRTLPTGVMRMPLLQTENQLLETIAGSSCSDGVCMVDPAFVKKLRRFAPNRTH